MKNLIRILIPAIFLCANAKAQDCDKLLQGSLYSFTSMTNTGSFSQDLRTYYLSESFKQDMKSGKWGSSLTIPIESTLLTLGMDFSDNEYQVFRSRLLQISELNISENMYQTAFSSIPNTNLYDAYTECVRIKNDASRTGFVQGQNVVAEDIVVFVIYYRPQNPDDPMPVVSSFDVQPSGSVLSGGLSTGQTLNSFSITVTCRRHEERDLVLSLNTDRGNYSSKSVADGPLSSSRGVPIGTIVASTLNFEQFSFTTKNNEKSPGGIWTSAKSRWAPCDGRPISNSKYQTIASRNNAPDLRGVFLRGANSFDPNWTVQPEKPEQLNPDNTPPNEYQDDAFESHNHPISNQSQDFAFRTSGMGIQSNSGTEVQWTKPNISVGNRGANETRPNNVTIYYYIKINN